MAMDKKNNSKFIKEVFVWTYLKYIIYITINQSNKKNQVQRFDKNFFKQ